MADGKDRKVVVGGVPVWVDTSTGEVRFSPGKPAAGQHSPGPWVWDEERGFVVDCNGRALLDCEHGQTDWTQTKVDLRFAAFAPAMYELLRQIPGSECNPGSFEDEVRALLARIDGGDEP